MLPLASLGKDKPYLVIFHAAWCGSCQTMTPILQQVQEQLDTDISYLEIDTDSNPQIAAAFQIRSIPSLILFHKGKVLWKHSGLIAVRDLTKQIAKHL